jgi:LysR family glycine cleavage system transcriptional activator
MAVRKIHTNKRRIVERRSLPLNSLRAFESAARQRSFSKAADELCVTHSAVSHQIKQLEEHLGTALFVRSNRGVRLTGAGETLLPVVGETFDRVAATLDGLISPARGGALKLTTTPSFAAKWLVPRLSRWRALNGDIGIHLVPTLRMVEFAQADADIGIRCGIPPWPGLQTDFLLPVTMTPLMSPALVEAGAAFDRPRDVLNHGLIHADVAGHVLGEEWRTWLLAAGVRDFGDLTGLSFHDPGLAMQAAIDGLGVAIGYLELAEADLAAGRLIRPFELQVRHSFSYYLVYPAARQNEAGLKAFRSWILAEAEDSLKA